MTSRRDRDTQGGNQGSSGVGADDRDRQGQRVQDPESLRATGVASNDKGETPAPVGKGRPNHGRQADTGDRAAKGEDRYNRPTRSGSRSNRS
jgi:hypothetical protein